MSYLGRSVDAISNVEKLDNITFNGGTTYALTKSSAAFTPAGKNNILISVSGVVQQGNFSVSGSNIVFDSAVAGTETCDFIMHYGTGLISTPADDTVSTAKIQNDAVTVDKVNLISTSSVPSLEAKGTSGQTEGYIQLNCAENSHGIKLKSPPHSAGASYTLTFPNSITNNQFLKTDSSGNLSFAEAGGGDLVLIHAADNSSQHNSVDIDGLFSSTYRNYKIFFETTATSGGYSIQGRLRTSSGGHTNGDYDYHFRRLMGDSDSTNIRRDNSGNRFQFTDATGSDTQRVGASLEFTILNPNSSSTRKAITMAGVITDTAGNPGYVFGGGQVKTSSAMVGMEFFPSGGSFQNSSFRCYGIKDS